MAELSGLSRATVSRALNGDRSVRHETRERVLHAANTVGYRPNRAARALASGRSGVLGFVLPVRRFHRFEWGPLLIESISDAVHTRNQQLMLWLGRPDPAEVDESIFHAGIVDGVIIAPAGDQAGWLRRFSASKVPVVLVGPAPAGSGSPSVHLDDAGGARRAVEHLVELGHRRIGVISGPEGRLDTDVRHVGHLGALRDAGVRIDPRLVVREELFRSGGRAAMRRLLPHHPTAVVTGNDEQALGAYEAIHDAGLRVPDDISVVGFDGFSPGRRAEPALTTIGWDPAELGTRAVEALLRVIDEGSGQPSTSPIDTVLVERASTAPPLRGPR